MNTIRLHFTDFSTDFVPEGDFFFEILSQNYNVELCNENPDYLFYSCYGDDNLNFDCVKIFYTAENIRPDFNLCDYAIGFDDICYGDRYFRFPNFARYRKQIGSLAKRPHLTVSDLLTKPHFCNFIYSNPFADPARDRFFYLLSKYKQVDSAGRHLNNVANQTSDRYAIDWRESKVDFQRHFKFTIAFENSSSPGYTTEKLLHAFCAQTIPIYWGNPDVSHDFNHESFINCHDFDDFNLVVDRVKYLDENTQAYLDMVNKPCFSDIDIPYHLSENALLEFLNNIFTQPEHHSRRRPKYGTTVMYEERWKNLARLSKLREKVFSIKRGIRDLFVARR